MTDRSMSDRMMSLWRRFRRQPTCGEILVIVQAHLDGEVDAATARRVVAHLEACEPCHHEAALYERIKEAMGRRRRPIDPAILDQLQAYGRRLPQQIDQLGSGGGW